MSEANYAGHVPPRPIPQPSAEIYDQPLVDVCRADALTSQPIQTQDLMKLVLSWENSARKQFECEARSTDPTGKKIMSHGATVYFNCALAIRRLLGQ